MRLLVDAAHPCICWSPKRKNSQTANGIPKVEIKIFASVSSLGIPLALMGSHYR